MAEPSQVEDFEPHVGKTFHFPASGHALTLSRIETGEPLDPSLRRPFTLVLAGPPGSDYLREGYLECRIEDGDAFHLYVSPVRTVARDRQDYQAVFN